MTRTREGGAARSDPPGPAPASGGADAHGVRTVPDRRSGRPIPRLWRDPAAALALVLSAALVLRSWAWISRPFGSTHDGRNGALWNLAGKALAAAPLGSGLGSEYRPGVVYANHPPLIVAMTAISRVFGTGPVAGRLPAIVASTATLLLLVSLMRALRCSGAAVCAGLLAAAATAMFTAFGTMLDTPVVGLPFGIAVLLVAVRIRDDRPPPAVAVVATFGLAAMVSWQAIAMAVLAATALVVHGRRSGQIGRATSQALAATVGGGGLTLAWLYSASGSFDTVLTQGGRRATGVSIPLWFGAQVHDAIGLWPVSTLVLAAVLGSLALTDRRTRPVLVGAVAVVLASTIGFRQGAYHHDYWNYWLLAVLALAVGCGTELLADRMPDRRRAVTAAVVTALALTWLANLLTTSTSEAITLQGMGAGSAVKRYVDAERTDPEAPLAYFGLDGEAADWILTAGVVDAVPVDERDELSALLDRRPDAVALVALPDEPSAAAVLRRRALSEAAGYAVVPAAEAFVTLP